MGAAFSDSACSNRCKAAKNIWSKSLGAGAAEADAWVVQIRIAETPEVVARRLLPFHPLRYDHSSYPDLSVADQ